MEYLLTFTWDFAKGLDLGFFTLRYYSLLFASGFVMGYFIMKRIFLKEGVGQEKLDSLLTYVVVATIIGARLGHVFFYQWDYYRQHPVEIFKVWEGGLASHGAAIAIVLAIYWYSRKVLKKPMLWMLDRLVITVALAGCMIRLGNFANSEIYGSVENSSLQTVYVEPVRERLLAYYGNYLEAVEFDLRPQEEEVSDSVIYPVYDLELRFKEGLSKAQAEALTLGRMRQFLASMDKEDQNLLIAGQSLDWKQDQPRTARVRALGVPRSPTQIYEAFAYLMIFFVLFRLYQQASLANRLGFLFGLFLVLVFGFRFFIEFFKENQVAAEEARSLNIGQTLSIPLVLAGLYFVFAAKPYSSHAKD